jgi:hypothetical protein
MAKSDLLFSDLADCLNIGSVAAHFFEIFGYCSQNSFCISVVIPF